MPIINFKGAHLSTEQKKELIQKFTETTKEVTHSPDPFITVIIEEYSDDNLGVGGKTVSEIKSELKK
ncbi:4-oxalocrotonate tautomerase DmpI [Marinifilum caeruleilacunae]|uniref:4-oxalocrotonate tautomerase family protein n=1 Tax=Marinifilum caeruleilacunae TaxID=2499076 RepID=A0ABX1WQD5_9BACT|nr:4-oxalocrotonate tautomerase DmpI [Marinifilum caeruleilacunae]NOU58299.1 4-oxalocrotonate tautomerase family protein [Marinifilum caeruleilacunae]